MSHRASSRRKGHEARPPRRAPMRLLAGAWACSRPRPSAKRACCLDIQPERERPAQPRGGFHLVLSTSPTGVPASSRRTLPARRRAARGLRGAPWSRPRDEDISPTISATSPTEWIHIVHDIQQLVHEMDPYRERHSTTSFTTSATSLTAFGTSSMICSHLVHGLGDFVHEMDPFRRGLRRARPRAEPNA